MYVVLELLMYIAITIATRSSDAAIMTGFLMYQGTPKLVTWPMSRDSMHRRDFYRDLRPCDIPHVDAKTKFYFFARWVGRCTCKQRVPFWTLKQHT